MSGPYIDEPVRYVSPFHTGTYEAWIDKVNDDGTVAIRVYLPSAISRGRGTGLDEPVVRLRSVSYGPNGRARPITPED